jgi:hypothetical protein
MREVFNWDNISLEDGRAKRQEAETLVTLWSGSSKMLLKSILPLGFTVCNY